MSFNDNSYFSGQGSVYIQKRAFNGSAIGPMLPVGDADKFTLNPKQTWDDIRESQSGNKLQSAHSLLTTDLMLDFTLLQFDKQNLVTALWGTDTGAVSAGTVSAEVATAYNGGLVPLANMGVSSVVSTLNGVTGTIASVAVTAGGTGYTPSSQLALTFTGSPGTGGAGYAITNAAGVIVGAYVTTAGSGYVSPTASVSGGGSGATFQVNMGAAALVAGTDYTLDATNGAMQFLPGSLLVPSFVNNFGVAPAGSGGVKISTNYSFAAYTGNIEVFTQGLSYYTLRLHGINIINQQPTIFTAYQCALDIAKAFNMIEAKHASLDLGGVLLQDTTKPLPTAAAPYSQFMRISKG